jgi:hypothetical protein
MFAKRHLLSVVMLASSVYGQAPVYQMHAGAGWGPGWANNWGPGWNQGWGPGWNNGWGPGWGGNNINVWNGPAPNVQAGSFQRPYPYHLDYYRMRYGGGYAPYFGNLYGTPGAVASQFYGAAPPDVAQQVPPQNSGPPLPYELPNQQVKCPHCGAMFNAADAPAQ